MTTQIRIGEPDDVVPMIATLPWGGNCWANAYRIEVYGGMGLA
jgi:hypothetical protein